MLDLLIVLVFIAYSITAGFRARRQASQGLTEYFLGGRSLRGWRAGTSMAATQYAADTPLLVAGLIAAGGVYSIWRLWVYAFAFLLMGFVLGRAWRNAGVLTDAELTAVRYSGRGVVALRALKAIYYGTVINCIVMAFVLVAAMRIFEVFLPWHSWLPSSVYAVLQQGVSALGIGLGSAGTSLVAEVATTNNVISIIAMLGFVALYSTTGGLRSVVATDVVQFGFMMLGTLLYAVYAVRATGGIEPMLAALESGYGAARADQMLSFVPPLDEALGPFLTVLALQWLFQVNSDGTGYLAQRTMACRSDRDARVAAVTFTLQQVALRSVLWLPIVIALLVIYPYAPGAAMDDAFIAEREMTFIRGIDDLLPAGARGLMLTGMLAALASTLDTHLNWGASYWSNDLYKSLWLEQIRKRAARPRELVWVARLSNFLVLAIALAVLANLGSIQQGWQLSLMFGAGIGSVLVLRWLWERVNMYCEIVAILVSIALAPLLLIYVEDDWLRLAVMSAASTIAVVLTALWGSPSRREVLVEFYRRVQPPGWWRQTALAAGHDPAEPRRVLVQGVVSIGLVALTTYGLLIGIGTFLLRPAQWLIGVAFLVVAIAAIPWWMRRI